MENKINIKHKEKKSLNKWKIVIILIVLAIIITLVCFFIKNHYKTKNLGNNMSNKNIEEIEEYILNISKYQAKAEVTVESNKNTNKYVIEQIYEKDKISKQTVLQPRNIEGLEIIYENNTIKINNSKIGATTVYENYEYIVDNFLWIDSFIEDYQNAKSSNNTSITEENDIVVMATKTKNENNKYVAQKKLYIDKETGKPTKLIIQDINKKNTIYILYNEITVNGLK